MALASAPLPVIAQAGRWMSESSCRLYVETSEVALLRVKQRMPQEQCAVVCAVARLVLWR
eukprot:11021460-Lingulodinium_polyedra.AAC.1